VTHRDVTANSKPPDERPGCGPRLGKPLEVFLQQNSPQTMKEKAGNGCH
jgi:hypothetical protein